MVALYQEYPNRNVYVTSPDEVDAMDWWAGPAPFGRLSLQNP